MTKLTIDIDNNVFRLVMRRAKQNLLTSREMVEDIVRRSMLSWRGGTRTRFKVDDKLVGIFSRERTGRKKKKKVRKKK